MILILKVNKKKIKIITLRVILLAQFKNKKKIIQRKGAKQNKMAIVKDLLKVPIRVIDKHNKVKKNNN